MKIPGKRLLVGLVCAGLSGCASIGPPLPPSLELPKPPADLHATRKGDKVTLTWTTPRRTTDRRSVRYLGNAEICRGPDPVLKQCGKPAGESAPPEKSGATKKSPPRLAASYVDTLSSAIEQENPSGFATYAVEVLNTAGRGAGLSNQVHVPLVPTLPPLSGFSGEATAQGVRITWKCPPVGGTRTPGTTYLFRIYRNPLSRADTKKIAEIDVTDCVAGPATPIQLSGQASNTASNTLQGLNPVVTSYLDQTFEWEKTYYYHGTVVSVIAVSGKAPVEVEGDDTSEVKVFADDVFPPAVPTGLQAVFSGPGQQPFIDLVWTPATEADLAGYNVYRREAGRIAEKLNSELIKTPAFRDTKIEAGAEYFYSVSAVDLRGNESTRSEETSERVPSIVSVVRLVRRGSTGYFFANSLRWRL